MIAGARTLVTGGAGTIGSTITDQLLDRDVEEVVVLDNFVRGRRANLAAAEASGRVTIVEGDVESRVCVNTSICGDASSSDESSSRSAARSVKSATSSAKARSPSTARNI